jgi:hypothetical protein
MYLGLPDSDPLIRDMDPDPYIILLSSSRNRNLDSYGFVISFGLFLSLKNDVNVPSESNKQKNFIYIILLASWRSVTKIAGSGSESGSGSTPKCHGSGTLHLTYCICIFFLLLIVSSQSSLIAKFKN